MIRSLFCFRFFAFALITVFVYSVPVSAAIVKGPYLENVGPDRITVSWESDQTTDGRLLYGIGDLSQEAAVLEGSGRQSITLTGLQAGKTYFYRLELYDGAFSPTLTFSTAPAMSSTSAGASVGWTGSIRLVSPRRRATGKGRSGR